MTIGATGASDDFDTLSKCRSSVCQELSVEEDEVELSMGMSGDYQEAILRGSTNIRVGSTIFGARDYPPKPKTPPAAEKETSAAGTQ